MISSTLRPMNDCLSYPRIGGPEYTTIPSRSSSTNPSVLVSTSARKRLSLSRSCCSAFRDSVTSRRLTLMPSISGSARWFAPVTSAQIIWPSLLRIRNGAAAPPASHNRSRASSRSVGRKKSSAFIPTSSSGLYPSIACEAGFAYRMPPSPASIQIASALCSTSARKRPPAGLLCIRQRPHHQVSILDHTPLVVLLQRQISLRVPVPLVHRVYGRLP